jgi:hypothetical protein
MTEPGDGIEFVVGKFYSIAYIYAHSFSSDGEYDTT